MRKKRKMDEPYLWAELSGVEAAIRDLEQRRGEIANELMSKIIKKARRKVVGKEPKV